MVDTPRSTEAVRGDELYDPETGAALTTMPLSAFDGKKLSPHVLESLMISARRVEELRLRQAAERGGADLVTDEEVN